MAVTCSQNSSTISAMCETALSRHDEQSAPKAKWHEHMLTEQAETRWQLSSQSVPASALAGSAARHVQSPQDLTCAKYMTLSCSCDTSICTRLATPTERGSVRAVNSIAPFLLLRICITTNRTFGGQRRVKNKVDSQQQIHRICCSKRSVVVSAAAAANAIEPLLPGMHNSTAEHRHMQHCRPAMVAYYVQLTWQAVKQHQQAHLLKELHCITNNSTLRVRKIVP
jgi:hypothetical protein